MDSFPLSPESSPTNSPSSSKAKSLKARWMKTFKEDSNGTDTFVQTENKQLETCAPVVDLGLLHTSGSHVKDSVATPPIYMEKLATPSLPVQLPFSLGAATALTAPLLISSCLENGIGMEQTAPASCELQYRLAQAQAQLGSIPNSVATNVEQSQMIKEATMLYLAQAELVRETNLAVSMAKINADGNQLTAHAETIPQGYSANCEGRNKISGKQQINCTNSGLQLPSQWTTKCPYSNEPSPNYECQLYPASTARAYTSHMHSTGNGIMPECSGSLERRHSENPGTESQRYISTQTTSTCNCSHKLMPSGAVNKVNKDMGIQTDDLPNMLLGNSPTGRNTIDQTRQLLQPYENCSNWMAAQANLPTNNQDNNINHIDSNIESTSVNSQGSQNCPMELVQGSVETSGIDTVLEGTSRCSSVDMTVLSKKDAAVSSTQCPNAADSTGSTTMPEKKLDYKTKRPVDNRCPVCGDEISGYHYGIYSCESCKGFFKRTVQSGRNLRLRCGRGESCTIDLESRKHCATCRFKKCLNLGMKLEAIREDRQRGGRSMYQGSSEYRRRKELQVQQTIKPPKRRRRSTNPKKESSVPTPTKHVIKQELTDAGNCAKSPPVVLDATSLPSQAQGSVDTMPSNTSDLDPLLKELLEAEEKLIDQDGLMDCCREVFNQKDGQDLFSSTCHLMDHQLYSFVKWARTLPLYKELKTEDQILLMQRRGLHLMAITLCFYFIDTDNRISLPNGQKVAIGSTMDEDEEDIMQRLVDTAGRFRVVKLDKCELVCLKGIMLLNPISQGLIETVRVQELQEKMEDLLIEYVESQPHIEDRTTGELLLRLSEIERVCQLIREQVVKRKVEGRLGRYPLLMELFQDKPSWLY